MANRGRPKKDSGFQSQEYKKAYQAINYQFNKAAAPRIKLIKSDLQALGVSEDKIKQQLRIERKRLQASRTLNKQSSFMSFDQEFKRLERLYAQKDYEGIYKTTKRFSPKLMAQQYKDNINKAINQLPIDNKTKQELINKIGNLTKPQLKRYTDQLETILMHYKDDGIVEEIDWIVDSILYAKLSKKNKKLLEESMIVEIEPSKTKSKVKNHKQIKELKKQNEWLEELSKYDIPIPKRRKKKKPNIK